MIRNTMIYKQIDKFTQYVNYINVRLLICIAKLQVTNRWQQIMPKIHTLCYHLAIIQVSIA